MKTPDLDRPRLFNTSLECGLRMLFVLNSCRPAKLDLQRLITYDYLIVHSGDVNDSPASLHPAVPFRGTEWLIKRDLVRSGLDLMFARELIEKRLEMEGIFYVGSDLTGAFVSLLHTSYANDLRSRADWVARRFGTLSDAELDRFMTENVGRWGAEFDRLTALQELELE